MNKPAETTEDKSIFLRYAYTREETRIETTIQLNSVRDCIFR